MPLFSSKLITAWLLLLIESHHSAVDTQSVQSYNGSIHPLRAMIWFLRLSFNRCISYALYLIFARHKSLMDISVSQKKKKKKKKERKEKALAEQNRQSGEATATLVAAAETLQVTGQTTISFFSGDGTVTVGDYKPVGEVGGYWSLWAETLRQFISDCAYDATTSIEIGDVREGPVRTGLGDAAVASIRWSGPSMKLVRRGEGDG
ncbi:hypothetical protein B0J12DRAFT_703374 [Macrophomina phaseolina]|uniref:Uncharacterized protein n=1 Tax=Macrophomina phaseolina TaxID=35725 RepID=A0ABQ8FYM0_9PEZI|nr:hypothetical protein B0J12DRAFT_703374 [Macrophomina phaseolina]